MKRHTVTPQKPVRFIRYDVKMVHTQKGMVRQDVSLCLEVWHNGIPYRETFNRDACKYLNTGTVSVIPSLYAPNGVDICLSGNEVSYHFLSYVYPHVVRIIKYYWKQWCDYAIAQDIAALQ